MTLSHDDSTINIILCIIIIITMVNKQRFEYGSTTIIWLNHGGPAMVEPVLYHGEWTTARLPWSYHGTTMIQPL